MTSSEVSEDQFNDEKLLFPVKVKCFYFQRKVSCFYRLTQRTHNITFVYPGQEASEGGVGVRRGCGRGFCHQCRHHRGRSVCLGFFLYSGVKGGAYQRPNRLQAASQTGYAADLIWKFTVLMKCSVSVLVLRM